MPLDDRLRAGLRKIADEVRPDIDQALQRATSTRRPSPIRRGGALLAYAAAAGLGIAVIGLGTGSLLDRFGASPSPTASAEASATSPTASATACPNQTGGSCAGALGPGQHRSTSFIPPLDFIIPADGAVTWDNPNDRPGTFTLHPTGPDTDAIFFFRDVRVVTADCTPQIDETVGNRATDIAAWMEANPNLTTSTPETLNVGGLDGVQLEVAVSGAYSAQCPGIPGDPYPDGMPIVPLFTGAGSGEVRWFVGGDERIRLYLLEMPGGGNLVIAVDAIGGDFATLLETCQPVIDSITFDPAYY
jgi:hypothetical protein